MSGGRASSREQVLRYIIDYKQDHDGLSPSVREIASACFLHVSTARYHLDQLAIEGRIRVLERRGIEVIGGAWEPPDNAPSGEESISSDVPSEHDHDDTSPVD